MKEQRLKKVGLALGGGAARGGAHLGAIRAIEEAGVRVDYVAGTSIGAMVGAAYAAGTIDKLERFTQQLEWREMITFLDMAFPSSGLIDGRHVTQFIDRLVDGRTFDELALPLSVVASDLNGGAEVVMCDGDVVKAVRASISIPGIFSPVRKGEMTLVDGGLVNPVPVTVVRGMGADFVIAVDLGHEADSNGEPRQIPRQEDTGQGASENTSRVPELLRNKARPLIEKLARLETQGLSRLRSREESGSVPNLAEVLLMSLDVMGVKVKEGRFLADPPDVLIQPAVAHVPFMAFHRAKELIEVGYEEAKSVLSLLE